MVQIAQGPTYLSMTELARRLDLPESTMRYYCKRFAKFLPYKGEGRRRRYAPETEKVLVFIASSMHENKNAVAVELMLQSGRYMHDPARALINAGNAASTGQARAEADGRRSGQDVTPEFGLELLRIMERQAGALSAISASLGAFVAQLAKYGEAVAARGETLLLAPKDGEAEEWRREIEVLKQRMSTAEQVHQEDLEQLRKWFGHLGEAVARVKG